MNTIHLERPMKKIIDLTHLIEPDMPVFPGTEPPIFIPANTIEKDGFAEKRISFFSHTGTHVDSPAHMLAGGKTLDNYDVSTFVGQAFLLDATDCPGGYINLEQLLPFKEQIQNSNLLVIRTGWSKYWGKESYFEGFPALTPESAEWIVAQGIRGIGIDAISIDQMGLDFPVHNILFASGVLVIENLTNLDLLEQEFTFIYLPLKIIDADGAPARAIAILS